MKKVICILMMCIFVFTMKETNAAEKAVFRNISSNQIKMENKQIYDIQMLEKYTKTSSKYKVTWKSKNKKIVTVSKKGRLKSRKVGKTTVICKVYRKKLKKPIKVVAIKIKVKKIVPRIQLTKKYRFVQKGKRCTLPVSIRGISKKDIRYKSSNKKVVTVNKNGIIKAVGYGNATVSIYSKKHKKIKVSYKAYVRKKVKRKQYDTILIQRNMEYQLDLTKQLANTTLDSIEYTTGDYNMIKISKNGVITTNDNVGPSDITIKIKDCFGAIVKQRIKVETVAEGTIIKDDLDRLNLDKIHKVMIVAHPDDEFLWGGGHLIQGDYLVITITNKNYLWRNQEFFGAIKESKDKGLMLTYSDRKNLTEGRIVHWTEKMKQSIQRDIQTILSYKNWEEVVTHNENGEYGHIHHIYTHELVSTVANKMKLNENLFYFSDFFTQNEFNVLKTQNKLPEELDKETLQRKRDIMYKHYVRENGTIKSYEYYHPYENWKQ